MYMDMFIFRYRIPSSAPVGHLLPETLWQQPLELQATALRCIKWWLRRRNIPVSKVEMPMAPAVGGLVWAMAPIRNLRSTSIYWENDGRHGFMNQELTSSGFQIEKSHVQWNDPGNIDVHLLV